MSRTFLLRLSILWICGAVFFYRASAEISDPAIKFIENKNQWPDDVQFCARVSGGHMYIGKQSFTYCLRDEAKMRELHEHSHDIMPDQAPNEQIKGHVIQATFLNANFSKTPFRFGQSREYYNFFLGDDPKSWASKAFAYTTLLYPAIYKDIDLKIYSSGNHVKYDFIVRPGGDPSHIAVRYNGADALALANGNLFIRTSLGDIIEQRPIAWQIIDGKKVTVNCAFKLVGDTIVYSFSEGYDSCYQLVIDPLLIFSTFSGSTADNWGSTATPGEHGTLYSSGVTNQTAGGNYPTTPGAFQITYGGLYDIGILKYDSTGHTLLYSSFLGGKESESPHSLVVDGNGDLVVLGTTSSNTFPTTTGAFDRSFNGGNPVSHVVTFNLGSDIFLSRISSDGTKLLGSTFIGGSENDGLNTTKGPLTKNYGDELRGDVITDKDGNVLVSSVTASPNFPTKNALQPFFGGATDAILFKFNPTLTQLQWSTFIGGSGTDASHTLKLDGEGNIFIGGGTTSANFPVTSGSYRTTLLGTDGWIAKVAADGSSILNATFVGGPSFDQVYFLDLNSEKEPYVYGTTTNPNFPATPGVYQNPGSGQFLQKFNNSLSVLQLSTVFGAGRGIPDISPTAFLVSECNNVYMSGWGGGSLNVRVNGWDTNTRNLPVTQDAYQKTTSGHDFYFIVLKDDASQLLYASYLGGPNTLTHVDGGTSRFDKDGIVYHAVCAGCNTDGLGPKSDFPSTPDAWSRTNNSPNCNNAAFKFDLASLRARLESNSAVLDQPGIDFVCIPDKIAFENLCIGGEIFIWDFGDGNKTTTDTRLTIKHQYKSKGLYLVKLKAIDYGTCKGEDSTSMWVRVEKPLAQIPADVDLCYGESYQLKASGGISYDWESKDGTFSSTESNPVVAPKDTMRYAITVQDINGCIVHDSVEVRVIPPINVDFHWQRIGCIGRPDLHLRNITDSLKSTDYIFFDFGDGQTSALPEANHTYQKDGIYHVTLTGQRESCVFERSADVPIFSMTMPNVITPGGSAGYNDTFTIQYGDTEGITPSNYGDKVSLKVYNRWGNILFSDDDYQYDWSGEGLSAGVYYYEVKIAGHEYCKSWLQILK